MNTLVAKAPLLAGGWAVVLVSCISLPGCGGGSSPREQQESNLRKLTVLYNQYRGENRGQAPASEDEFKGYLDSLPSETLEGLDVTDAESLFTSPRDGKSYVLIYGSPGGPSDSGQPPVIAYEQEGKGGKRLVATSLGAIEEVDEARFKELVPDAP